MDSDGEGRGKSDKRPLPASATLDGPDVTHLVSNVHSSTFNGGEAILELADNSTSPVVLYKNLSGT